MPTPEHTRLLTAAARSILRPLGCVQKGRSRTWLDDQDWWVGVVEFQPSAWDVTRTRRALGLPEWRSSPLIPPG